MLISTNILMRNLTTFLNWSRTLFDYKPSNPSNPFNPSNPINPINLFNPIKQIGYWRPSNPTNPTNPFPRGFPTASLPLRILSSLGPGMHHIRTTLECTTSAPHLDPENAPHWSPGLHHCPEVSAWIQLLSVIWFVCVADYKAVSVTTVSCKEGMV